jgi:hypothetical protein
MKHAILTFALLLLILPAGRAARASNLDSLDPSAVAQLESKASHAELREQTFLYTQLVHVYSQLAGQQLAAGDSGKAHATLKKMEDFIGRIQIGLSADAHKLKRSEMLLEAASFRLSQLAHHASSEDQPALTATVQQIDKVHGQMLTQVFAH